MVEVIPVLYLIVGTRHLTQNVSIYTTHIKKIITNLCFFSERWNDWETITGQKFRLTPGAVSHKFLTPKEKHRI